MDKNKYWVPGIKKMLSLQTLQNSKGNEVVITYFIPILLKLKTKKDHFSKINRHKKKERNLNSPA